MKKDDCKLDNFAAKLDQAKREIMTARFFEIPADPVMALASGQAP